MLIRPSTVIQEDYEGVAELCRSTDEPLVLTHEGEADLVVMSYELFRRREARAKLQAKLAEAQLQFAAGNVVDPDELFAWIQERIDSAERG